MSRGFSGESKGIFLAAVSAACFGSLGIFIKFAYADGMNALTFISIRLLIGAIIIWGWSALNSYQLLLPLKQVVTLAVIGVLGFGSFSMLFFKSVELIPVSLAAILLYTYPAIVLGISALMGEEPFSSDKLLAIILSGTGLLLVIGPTFDAKINPIGVAVILFASLVYSVYIVLINRILRKKIPSVIASAYVITSAALFLTLIGLIAGGISFTHSWIGLASSIGSGIICTFLAISTFYSAISLIGPSRASIVSTLEPFVTVSLSVALFSEKLSFWQVFGGLIIIFAITIMHNGFKISAIMGNKESSNSRGNRPEISGD